MDSTPRRFVSALVCATLACATLTLTAGPAGAAMTGGAPSDLTVSLLSPHAGITTGEHYLHERFRMVEYECCVDDAGLDRLESVREHGLSTLPYLDRNNWQARFWHR